MDTPPEIPCTVELLIWLASIGSPSTTSVDYDQTVGGNLKTDARELLKVATIQRQRMTEGLSYDDVKVDPRNVVGAVDSYLPSLWQLTASMEASSDANIKLKRKLEFSWTSQLGKKKKEWKFGVLVFEVAYVLMVRSIAHLDTAASLLVSSRHSSSGLKVNEASTELRLGAGIQEYVSNDLLPRWVSPPKQRPHEVLPPVVSTLSLMLQAGAQRLAIAKAILNGSPASLIAKLLMGTIARYDMAIRILRTLDRESFEGINDCIRDELGTMPVILRALTAKYMGIASHDKEKWGVAVAFLQEAERRLIALELGVTMQKALQASVIAERAAVQELLHTYHQEATNVYFDMIPPPTDLEFPDGTFIIKPVPYTMPDLPLVSFAEEVKIAAAPSANGAPPEYSSSKSASTSSYFAKKQSTEVAEEIKCPEGIDPSAFAALPIDIQREIAAQGKSTQAASTLL